MEPPTPRHPEVAEQRLEWRGYSWHPPGRALPVSGQRHPVVSRQPLRGLAYEFGRIIWFDARKGRVSKVEMAIPMALIYKGLCASISTFETPPQRRTGRMPRPSWEQNHRSLCDSFCVDNFTEYLH